MAIECKINIDVEKGVDKPVVSSSMSQIPETGVSKLIETAINRRKASGVLTVYLLLAPGATRTCAGPEMGGLAHTS